MTNFYQALKDHPALLVAAIIGICHYNGNMSFWVYTESFGVSGIDEQNIYSILTWGFTLLVIELLLFAVLYMTIFFVRFVAQRYNGYKLREYTKNRFEELFYEGDRLINILRLAYIFSFYLLFAPIISGAAYAENVKFLVDGRDCFTCRNIGLENTEILGQIITADTSRLAVYEGGEKVRIVAWDDVRQIDGPSLRESLGFAR